MGRGLSETQCRILAYVRDYALAHPDWPRWFVNLDDEGQRRLRRMLTGSEQADAIASVTLSRALRRLEQRRLIERTRGGAKKGRSYLFKRRTANVRLTDAGRAVARDLPDYGFGFPPFDTVDWDSTLGPSWVQGGWVPALRD